jgi:hypothetical protein
MVRHYLVLPGDAVGSNVAVTAPTLVDVGNTLRHKYRIGRRAMLLVRPDGYLALRHDEWAPAALRSQLLRWLVPAQSTQLEEA